MDLVKYHSPSSPEQLRELIEHHHTHDCAHCGCKSAGTVEQFASRLYNAQFNEPRQSVQRRYTWDECYLFHYTLFCVAPLRGVAMEKAVQNAVATALTAVKNKQAPNHTNNNGRRTNVWTIREATQREDFDCAVDLVMEWTDHNSHTHTILGLQVKPQSVLKRKRVMEQNRHKQRTFGAPVLFVVYNNHGKWTPTTEHVVEEAERLRPHPSHLSHPSHPPAFE